MDNMIRSNELSHLVSRGTNREEEAYRLAGLLGPYEFPIIEESSDEEIRDRRVSDSQSLVDFEGWRFETETSKNISKILLKRLTDYSLPFIHEAFAAQPLREAREQSRVINFACLTHLALSQAEREEKPLYSITRSIPSHETDIPQIILITNPRQPQPDEPIGIALLENTVRKLKKVAAIGLGKETAQRAFEEPIVVFAGHDYHFQRSIERGGGFEGMNHFGFSIFMPFHRLHTLSEEKTHYYSPFNDIFGHEFTYTMLLHFFGPQKAAFLFRTPNTCGSEPSGFYQNTINRFSNGFLDYSDEEIEQLAQIPVSFYEEISQQIISSASRPLLFDRENFLFFPIIKNGVKLPSANNLIIKVGEKIRQRCQIDVNPDLFGVVHSTDLEWWLGYHVFIYLLKNLPEQADIEEQAYNLLRNFVGDGIVRMKGKVIKEMAERYDLYQRYRKWLADPEVSHGLSIGFCQSEETFKRWLESLDREDNETHLIFSDGEPIGHISLREIDRESETAVGGLIIGEKRYWRRGICTSLFKWREKRAKELGIKKIISKAKASNLPIQVFLWRQRPSSFIVDPEKKTNIFTFNIP